MQTLRCPNTVLYRPDIRIHLRAVACATRTLL